MSRLVPMFLLVTVVTITAIWFSGRLSEKTSQVSGPDAMVPVTVPPLSAAAEQGARAFNDNCAVCHGTNAAGRAGSGPPLVHIIYEPNHHGDASFHMAVRNGVRSHHWSFGDMAPVPGVSEDEVASIIAYVRELQRANGIH